MTGVGIELSQPQAGQLKTKMQFSSFPVKICRASSSFGQQPGSDHNLANHTCLFKNNHDEHDMTRMMMIMTNMIRMMIMIVLTCLRISERVEWRRRSGSLTKIKMAFWTGRNFNKCLHSYFSLFHASMFSVHSHTVCNMNNRDP